MSSRLSRGHSASRRLAGRDEQHPAPLPLGLAQELEAFVVRRDAEEGQGQSTSGAYTRRQRGSSRRRQQDDQQHDDADHDRASGRACGSRAARLKTDTGAIVALRTAELQTAPGTPDSCSLLC